MNDIWLYSLPILLVDIVNPVLLAGVAISLTGKQPVVRSSALILGHTTAYFAVGVLVVYGLADLAAPILEKVKRWVLEPTPLSFLTSFILGLILVVIAVRWKDDDSKKPAKEEKASSGILPAFFLGATINFVGAPFAVPYFGFINELFRFEVESKMLALIIYNLGYALPFAIFPVAFIFYGPTLLRPLNAINQFIERTSAWLVPSLLGILGVAFVVDAIKYFITGTGLV